MTRRRGFTLVELLTVMLLIGILATIAIPRFTGAKERAIVAAMRTDLRNLATMEEAYQADHGRYTASLDDVPFHATTGTEVVVVTATETGWSAQATEAASRSRCVIASGSAPALAPGAEPAQIVCE